MDFFGHQEQARKRTTLLLACYALAVTAITLGVYGLFVVILAQAQDTPPGQAAAALTWWHPDIFLATLVFVPGVILGGTAIKTLQLNRGGGSSVARMLGGSPVAPDTRDPDERRLLNVVEEMALAAGVPVPAVYVLTEERGINAFAAGYSPRDAVIGVTRGCIQNLSRDQLQGVIAHEFSHIIHGDMRLNIRLMGVLFGIVMITLIGRILLQSAFFSGGSRGGRGGNKKGGNPLLYIGIGLMAIGYIGVFFASIIKSAVSRQREYLADAAAVQFTRNPGGIAGALARIRALSLGSKVGHVRASEAGHLFFGDCSRHMVSLFATHPPLDVRIKRIDPQGTWTREADSTAAGKHAEQPPAPAAGPPDAEDAELAGILHLAAAQSIIQRMPAGLEQAAHDTIGARALLYALLWGDTAAIQQKQRHILETEDPQTLDALDQHFAAVQALPTTLRLPLAERLLPALRTMPSEHYRVFSRVVDDLAAADEQIDLFEFAIRSMTMRHLGAVFGKVSRAKIKYRNIENVSSAIRTVLSALARWGTEGDDVAASCFAAGLQPLQLTLAASPDVSLPDVEQALETLSQAAPFIKRRLIDGCRATILADGQIGPNQYELLRAVADAIDVPMPPLQAG